MGLKLGGGGNTGRIGLPIHSAVRKLFFDVENTALYDILYLLRSSRVKIRYFLRPTPQRIPLK